MYKGKVGVLRELLSKFFQSQCFFFAITGSLVIQIE